MKNYLTPNSIIYMIITLGLVLTWTVIILFKFPYNEKIERIDTKYKYIQPSINRTDNIRIIIPKEK